MIRIFFLSQSSPILELFSFDKISLKSYICTVVTVMAKQCWSQTVLESGSWGHSVLQTPALVLYIYIYIYMHMQAMKGKFPLIWFIPISSTVFSSPEQKVPVSYSTTHRRWRQHPQMLKFFR